jgi:HAD superfamily hydrolase (TIGR01490 family)
MQAGSTTTQIAVFDYDGTSVDGQSGSLFTTYLLSHGMMSLPRALRLGWWGIRYKLHLPFRQDEARELVFGALGEMTPDRIDEVMRKFHDDVLGKKYRQAAIAEVARRREEGCVTLLVSATFDIIADAAAEVLGVDAVLATHMERDEKGHYTGRVAGTVVAGDQKYRAVAEWCDERFGTGAWQLAYAYGDHHTDEDLLSRARTAYAVCPGQSLKAVAKKRGWQILDWDD